MGNIFGKKEKDEVPTIPCRRACNVHVDYERLAQIENIDERSARNIVQLFQENQTLPFICRYRRDLISRYITPEKLRHIKNTYNRIVALRQKAESTITEIQTKCSISEDVRTKILCAKTDQELEFLSAPYKRASKPTLLDNTKVQSLEVHAHQLLSSGSPHVQLEKMVDHKNVNLNSRKKVADGISHIISESFIKHTGVLDELHRLRKVNKIVLKSTKVELVDPKAKCNRKEQLKYDRYFSFENDVRSVKPHQMLAINRAEKSNFVSVEIIVPEFLKLQIKHYIREQFLAHGVQSSVRNEIFDKAFEECYTKTLEPSVISQVRADLNDAATKASIDVFAKNLKQLLLMSPLKGERILGIDPGLNNGCKLALISETADVLEVGELYLHTEESNPNVCGTRLANMLTRNGCKIIALGNGTGCRETELWLTKLFERGTLDRKHVKYSIVSDQGASFYACSAAAKKECPKLDMHVIRAVSIARRLNDPLSEYVKIKPQDLGVGMYQRDINEKLLTDTLKEVVSECVSFVGVDINTASLSVLKHIAGLTESHAEKIIRYRQENGPFSRRTDLLRVKAVGEQTFQQCAGFIRIEPKTVGGKVDNLLDCTWVHPESYIVAEKIIRRCNLNLQDIGKPTFIKQITYLAQCTEVLVTDLGIPTERLKVVLEALQRPLFKDYRSDLDKKPLFKQGITRMKDLFIGEITTGAVTNITHFGAFVDIGVEVEGLIHTSKMNGKILSLGDRVSTTVLDVDIDRNRIQLRLDDII